MHLTLQIVGVRVEASVGVRARAMVRVLDEEIGTGKGLRVLVANASEANIDVG